MASVLDRLKYKISDVGYKLGLPGAGISLKAGTPYNSQNTPSKVYNSAGTRGEVKGTTTNLNPQAQAAYRSIAMNPKNSNLSNIGTFRAGGDTQTMNLDGGGGGGGGGEGGDGSTQEDLAQRALQSRLDSINQRLALLTQEGERLNGVASGVRDEVVGNIGNTYDALEAATGTARTRNINALAEEDRGTTRDYAINQGVLNRSTEGAVGKNRALARALGYGNSSYYMDAQDKARTTGLDKTTANQNEKTAKLTAIKGKVGDTETWYNQKLTEFGQEEATLKSQAEREYQEQVAQNALLSRTYGIDSVDAAEQAQVEYESKLDVISKYIGSKADQVGNIAGIASRQTAGVNAYNAVDEIQPTLSNFQAFNSAAGGVSPTIGSGGFAGTSTGARPLISNSTPRKSTLDQYLYPQPLFA